MLGHLKEGGIARALRHASYRRYAGGDVVSMLGDWVQRVAVGWLTWELTHSGVWLGILAIAELFPSVVFAPLGGAYADKADRLRITIVTQAILMAQAATLATLTFTGLVEVWSVLALTFLRGSFNAWSHPARQALIPSLVPQQDLSTAIALNSVLFNIARFIGPAIAGVIIAHWGVGPAFLFNTATFVAFLVALIGLKRPYAEVFQRTRQSLGAQLAEAYRYVARHPGIGPILVLMLTTALLARPVGDLLPGFSGAVFERGATGLAWLTSAMGLGAMVGAFGIAQRGRMAGLTRLAVRSTLIMSLALLVFAFAPHFWVALAALAVASFAMTQCGIAGQSLVQFAVAANLRGRVVSIYGVIFRAGPATGALAIGALSEYIGWRLPLAAGAALCLAAWLWGRHRRNDMTKSLES